MLDLYANIKNRRLALGMSQEDLAQKVGYADRTSIAKIEAGKVDISQSKIMAFAAALHVTASELMGWKDEEPTQAMLGELSKDELEVLKRYRAASDEIKGAVRRIVES